MTKNTILATAAAALSAAVLSMPLLAGSASASTTSKLMQCQGNTKQQVVSCCQRVLETRKRPLWMTASNSGCAAVAKCVGGGKPKAVAVAYVPTRKPKCAIYLPQLEDGGRSNDTPNTPDRPSGRTPGNNGNTKPF